PPADVRAGFYPSLAHGTVPSSYDTRTAGDTSYLRSCPAACVGCASALRSRPPALRRGPNPPGPAPGLERPAAPGGGLARGAPPLCGGDAVSLWSVVYDTVWYCAWGLLPLLG